MDKIYEYLKGNPQYVTALIVTFALIIAACILGYFINKYNWLKFMDNWFGKNKKEPPQTPTDKKGGDDTTNGESGDTFSFESFDGEELPDDETNETESSFPSDETVITDASAAEETSFDAAENIDEEKPKKNSRLSEMLRRSMESGTVEEYEADRKYSQALKQPAKSAAAAEVKPPVSQAPEIEYEGKWRILRIGNVYVAHLFNDKDLLLLKSQNYSNVSGAKNAVESLKKNIKGNNFTVTVNKDKKFCFKLFSKSGRFICAGENCDTSEECKSRIEEVKRIAFKAEVIKG